LITDVFRSRPLLCTIRSQINFTLASVKNVPVVPEVLDKGHQRVRTMKLFTLDEVATILRYIGTDRERSVRGLFRRHGITILRRDHDTWLVTEAHLATLMEALDQCSRLESDAAASITSAERSASAAPRESSTKQARDLIAERMLKRTGRSSRRKSGASSLTVLAGGRRT
jgi:hypothetical protein